MLPPISIKQPSSSIPNTERQYTPAHLDTHDETSQFILPHGSADDKYRIDERQIRSGRYLAFTRVAEMQQAEQ